MRSLYPQIQENQTWMIEVEHGHQIYVEESGNPDGIPVVYCHGGPGGGSDAIFRRFYDPEKYRIILFDQRGCGQSKPHCAKDINAIWNNTTLDLMNDMERIRQTLKIDSWLVTGGSWGTTLALLYAIEFPERVKGLILRGVFLARQQDIDWLFGAKQGASQLFPEFYRFLEKGHDSTSTEELLASYYEQLVGDNDLIQLAAAKQFCNWEGKIARLSTQNAASDLSNKDAIAMAMLNCHYFTNNSFIYEHEIISEIDRIKDIPGYIIHGRYDVVCKVEGAYELSKYWQNGKLEIVPEAGHSCLESGVKDALIRAADKMANFLESNR